MAAKNVYNFNVVLICFVFVKFSVSQIDVGTEITTKQMITSTICSVCSCADGVVDCMNLNISNFFDITAWEELNDFQPTTVDLSQNLMTTVTKISSLPIQVLNLSNCQIQYLEDSSFTKLENLTILDLSGNQISSSFINRKVFCGPKGPTPDIIRNFERLQYINLANNDLHTLSQDMFIFMPGLLTLDLSGNPLVYIDQITMGAMSDLKNLKELRLSNCELETLPDGLLRRHRKLRKLDLSVNRLTAVPAALGDASASLEYLNLDKNSIHSLEANNAITNLTKLKELSLCRLSRLQNISAGALSGLVDLEVLRLNYNPRLTNLHQDFLVWTNKDNGELWPYLRELYLNNNNLSGIDSGYLNSWQGLKTGDFSNNPYSCDCSNQWMVDVLVPLLTNSPANATLANMVCNKPSEFRGVTFAQLNKLSKILVCAPSQNIGENLSKGNMAIILGIMIGIVVTFPIVLVLVLLWRKGYFSKLRSSKFYQKDHDDEHEDL